MRFLESCKSFLRVASLAWLVGATLAGFEDASADAVGIEFDLEPRRRQHWAWHPIRTMNPPVVKDPAWVCNPVDRFILAKLEATGLKPASAADKRTLFRRLCFDLTGLPPASDEVEAFVQDGSSGAYESAVDRLLASPHFGERWARHWLDLVRYAETLGHEFDYPIHNAWRYRDYVIRAFNDDLPYDQWVTEHVAGDLLSPPRRHPIEGYNESIIGTAFFWFGQQTHSPVDVRQHQSDVIENQIDVLTKTFLGLTVACARCHDHKFDALSTRDYYALYGVLESSRYAQCALTPGQTSKAGLARLGKLKIELRQAVSGLWSSQADSMSQYLLAAHSVQSGRSKSREEAAREFHLDAARLSLWADALKQASAKAASHPLHLWNRFAATNPAPSPAVWQEEWQALLAASKKSDQVLEANARVHTPFVEFKSQDYRGWFCDGEAFGDAPRPVGEWVMGDTNRPVVQIWSVPVAHSGGISRRLQGALRSPTFTITQRYLHLLVAGRDSRVNVFIDNFTLIQSPIYGSLRQVLDSDEPHWLTIDLGMWSGHRACLEFSDLSTPDLASGGKTEGYGPTGYIAVGRILCSDDKSPPEISAPFQAFALLGEAPVDGLEALARRYQRAAIDAVTAWASNSFTASDVSRAQIALLNWLVQHRLLDVSGSSRATVERIGELMAEFRELESAIPIPARVPAMADGNGLDEHVFVRGNPKLLGDSVPRRFLEAIAGTNQRPYMEGSGRLELARQMTDSSNPFLARVMANRVWLHIFGRGLVPTPDDFGVLGQPPTHPELLDWLATHFRDEARWSTKKLIRLLVTSNAYRMASESSDPAAEVKDPDNALLHRMPVRRLEGEAIRDALLAVSGRLDRALFGPPVSAHLNEFMDGRGRPAKSGPLDGAGRRSIYLEVRRNFLAPMMRAFDTPVPFTTVGRRTASNVPAQSLILMNDPFVVDQARVWAARLLRGASKSPKERLTEIFLAAFSRPPTSAEVGEALDFLRRQSEARGDSRPGTLDDEQLWADLCHVIFNAKEFIFVN